MKITEKHMLLYAVTDRQWLTDGETLASAVDAVLKGGATCVQLREKDVTDEQFIKLAEALKPICHKYNVPFIINDNVSVAKAVDADGVHIGQDDMTISQARAILGPDKIIGTSAHNVAEAIKAVADGADYIGCGAVFGSGTKTDASYLGVDGLKAICDVCPLPVVAIGGINKDNIHLLKHSGTDGVALVSALFSPSDKTKATAEMLAMAKEITE